MRIIGGRDYYDTAMGYGIDKTLVFSRKEITFECNHSPLDHHGYFFLTDKNAKYKMNHTNLGELWTVVVYVAGRRYTGMRVRKSFEPHETFWSLEKLSEWVDKNDFAFGITSDWYYHHWKQTPIAMTYEGWFENQGVEANKDQLEWMIQNRVVIAVYNEQLKRRGVPELWHCNGDVLKEYNFQKVLDPYTAFQEISMFVGGVLPREGREMVEVSDKSLVAKHGFDKWSFRKHKDDNV